jgi:hypothetical protein
MTSNTTYILIDYENVQPTELRRSGDEPIKVKLFLGAKQTKISVSLATSMHALGENAEYVQIESNGTNALDFHIAYYIGRLAALEPAARFQIISNDTGFDPLIKYLKSNRIRAERTGTLASVVTKMDAAESDIELVMDFLTVRKCSKPRSQKTLINSIRSLFRQDRTEKQVSAIFQSLCTRGIIRIEGTRVVYDSLMEKQDEADESEGECPMADEDHIPF